MENINRNRQNLLRLTNTFYHDIITNQNISNREIIAEYMIMVNFMYEHLGILQHIDRNSIISIRDDLRNDLLDDNTRIHTIMGEIQLEAVLQPLVNFLDRIINNQNPFMDQ